MRSCYLFAGPSLTPAAYARAEDLDVAVLPPVRRGDIEILVKTKAPSVIVVADGCFDQSASVGHAELRNALQGEWNVWGVSSMGAIRAYELRKFGMRGCGSVYEMFFRVADFQDDEVALLHSPDPPFQALSEPLVHMRVALAALVSRGVVDHTAALKILRKLKVLWYGDRTLQHFEDLVQAKVKAQHQRYLSRALQHFDCYRIKQKDLAAVLAAKPWVNKS